jgi:hypothetical protein
MDVSMDEELLEKAEAFAEAHGCTLGDEIGFGIHGSVVLLERESQLAASALKVHFSAEPFRRECEVYERLGQNGVRKILGCHVPQLLRQDDALLAIEMTIVPVPFVLDFAGAWLDRPPHFSDEIWEERTAKWAREFGADWAQAQAVLAELEEFGVHQLDPSPRNIRFR